MEVMLLFNIQKLEGQGCHGLYEWI